MASFDPVNKVSSFFFSLSVELEVEDLGLLLGLGYVL